LKILYSSWVAEDDDHGFTDDTAVPVLSRGCHGSFLKTKEVIEEGDMLAIDQRKVPSQSVRISTRFLGSKAYVLELVGAKKTSLKKRL
jgi:hypothetical protein